MIIRPVVPSVVSTRRGPLASGDPWDGERGGVAFSPLLDPLVRFWWNPTTQTAGAVSSWTDVKSAVSAANGTGPQQPTQSATSMNGYPGIGSDGGDLLTANISAVVGGDTQATLTLAMLGSPPATRIVFEHTANSSSTDGGLELDSSGAVLDVYARGTADYSGRRYTVDTTTAKVISVGFDLSVAGVDAIVFCRSNGVALSPSTLRALSQAGTIASASLRMFARSGVVVPWAGTLGHFVWRESAAQDAGLIAIERYIGARSGLSW